ncbi:MAG: glycosyltransferase family 39 protein [Thermoflexales bacterium]|nr:glycosyltransferase family 39 protein [Thermoflexales bacterium]
MHRYERWLILICLLLAFGLRVYRLDGQEIWGDEAYSITIASWPFARAISAGVDTHPPLYPAVLWGTIRLAGKSPFAVRFPSALAGLVTVALIYQLGRIAGKGTALWAAGLASASAFLIYYSQEARMYALSLMGATGSMLTFWLALAHQQNSRPVPPGLWGIYVLSSLVAIYSHYYAFAVLLAQFAFVLIVAAKTRKPLRVLPWMAYWVAMAFCFLPWMREHFRFLGGKASARFEEWTFAKFGEISARTLLAYAAGKTLPAAIREWGWGIVVIALLGLGRLLVSGKRWLAGFLFLTLTTGFLFAWTINPIMPFFEERYLLACAPPFLVLTASGLTGWKHYGRIWTVCGASFLICLNSLSLRHYHFDPTFHKGEYGSLMAHIAARAQEGDVILLNNPLQESLFEYYHPQAIPYRLIPREVLLTDEEAGRFLKEVTEGYRRAWLVDFGNPQEYDPSLRARSWLARHGYLGFRQDYLGATLSMFILNASTDIEHPMDVVLGDEIRLRGYSLKTTIGHPGGFLLLTLYWEALRPIANSYTVFVHLLDSEGHLAAQIDSPPAGGTLPTNTWAPGEVIPDHYALPLPADLASGQYQLNIGMYLWPEMQRLPVTQNGQVIGDIIPLGIIEIR